MKIRLLPILKELETQVNGSQNLLLKVKSLGMPQIQVEIIAELAFLRIFIAWENFLEESFIRYLVGGKAPSGYSPRRFVNPPNMKIAMKIISGDRDYIKWNSAGEIIARSRIYFKDGEPYKTALEAATTDLDEVNTIRNRIAHKSNNTKNKFNDFIRRKFGHGKRGMTPGRFLLTPTNSTSQLIFLDHYVGIIKTASKIIVQ